MKALSLVLLLPVAAMSGSLPRTTFTKDIAPIFHQRCAECHRAGEVAPMSLLTYSEARPWAKAIKQVVLQRSMPPWLANPQYGHFRNDRRLTQKEVDTIVAWVDAGAPEGAFEDMPAIPHFETGWTIGKPDMVVSLENEVDVPAEGVIPYKYFRVPSGFTEDKWVQAAEIRPGNRAVVHHIIVSAVAHSAESAETETGETARRGRGEKICGFAPDE